MLRPIYKDCIGHESKGVEEEVVEKDKVSEPSSIVTDVRLLHSPKTLSPIDVTLLGIVTEVRPLQL